MSWNFLLIFCARTTVALFWPEGSDASWFRLLAKINFLQSKSFISHFVSFSWSSYRVSALYNELLIKQCDSCLFVRVSHIVLPESHSIVLSCLKSSGCHRGELGQQIWGELGQSHFYHLAKAAISCSAFDWLANLDNILTPFRSGQT